MELRVPAETDLHSPGSSPSPPTRGSPFRLTDPGRGPRAAASAGWEGSPEQGGCDQDAWPRPPHSAAGIAGRGSSALWGTHGGLTQLVICLPQPQSTVIPSPCATAPYLRWPHTGPPGSRSPPPPLPPSPVPRAPHSRPGSSPPGPGSPAGRPPARAVPGLPPAAQDAPGRCQRLPVGEGRGQSPEIPGAGGGGCQDRLGDRKKGRGVGLTGVLDSRSQVTLGNTGRSENPNVRT